MKGDDPTHDTKPSRLDLPTVRVGRESGAGETRLERPSGPSGDARTATRHRQMQEILLECLELDEAERAAWLDRQCGTDEELRAEVEELLAEVSRTGGFLETPVFEKLAQASPSFADSPEATVVSRPAARRRSPPSASTAKTSVAGSADRRPTRKIPKQIGPYRILSILGEGGMGCVYLARQEVPVRRKVALKLIQSSLTTPAAISRFTAERQAMARLAHPAIAQIFEAGTTEDGYPYFVMEHVPGSPVTEFCDERRLSLRARLEIFIEICSGVEHAHRKGILHRDLKPSNVLVADVDGRPIPKIIDFGIAKAIDQPLTEATQLTRGGIGTPAYMSPEALDGDDVDTRSDIYSLGILLYELLAGERPFDLRKASMSQIVDTIFNKEPTRPSTRFRSLEEARQMEIAALRGTDRRQQARALEGDIDWITTRAIEKDRDRRYGSATELAADVRRHLDLEPVSASPPSLPYRAGRFIRRYRGVVIAASLALIALILGTIGTTIGMMRAQREAAKAREALLDAEEVTGFLVHLFEVSDPREAGGESTTARQLLDRGAERIEERLADQPLRQARLMHTIGTIYDQLQVHREAHRLISAALEIRERELQGAHRETADSLHKLAVVERELAEYDAAETAARRELEMQRELHGPEHPLVAEALRELAVTLYLSGRFEEAEPLVQQSLSILRRELGDDAPPVANSLETLGNLLKEQGRCFEAIPSLEKALEIRQQNLDPSDPSLALSLNNLASCYGETQRLPDALPLFERALTIQEKSLGPQAIPVAVSRTNLGIVYRELGQLDSAEAAFNRSHDDLAAGLGPTHPLTANPRAELGVLLWKQGRLVEAEQYLREALGIWMKKPGPDHPLTAWAHWGLANILRDGGQPAEAEAHYRNALAIRERVLPADHPDLRQTRSDYAQLLRASGREDEASGIEAGTAGD